MNAALALIAEGELVFSLRKVARRAGVSPAAPYHHFADRETLLAAVAAEGFRALDQAIADATRAKRSPQTVLRARIETYVRFSLEHYAHYSVMFASDLNMTRHEELGTVARLSLEGLRRAIASMDPSASPGELARRTGLAWALAHGAVELTRKEMLAPTMNVSVDEVAREVGAAIVTIASGE